MSESTARAETPARTLPLRLAGFIYGAAAYVAFLLTFLYFIGFVGDIAVPKTVDGTGTLPSDPAIALDLLLIALFGLQHSVMARPSFKRWWTRIVPRPLERSTYVLVATLVLIAVMAFWQPIGSHIWHVTYPVGFWGLWAVFALGWAVLLLSTFMTDHFDLFGLRQVWFCLRGTPYKPVALKARGFYRHMRHPLYTGFLLAFWATPHMTAGHLVLALGFSAYIVVGTLLEERDLIAAFGQRYTEYSRYLPRYVPRLRPHRN